MPIIAKSEGGSGTFTPHPEGQFAAVCVDVHDLGLVEVTWQGVTKKQHKVDVWFYCGEDKMENGKPATYEDGKPIRLMVRERLTLSLHPQSRMRPFLEGWRGKKFSEEEEQGFDIEALIGVPAFLQISHNENGGKTYANIDTIMRLPEQMTAPSIPADYVRFCDRPEDDDKKGKPSSGGWGAAPPQDRFSDGSPVPAYGPPDDDDLPF